jgi:vitamin B12 transporter
MFLILVFHFIFPQSFAEEDKRPIIVTAERSSRSYSETTSSITVFDREAIENLHGTNLSDLLQRVPGISVSSSGAYRKATSLFVRGTDTRHTKILIDGVPVGDPTGIDGSPRLEFISLDQVERVEVLKGPQGALYGSGAMGGVILITTRSSGKQEELAAGLGLGSHKFRAQRASVRRRKDDWSIGANLVHEEARGVSAYSQKRNSAADRDPYSLLVTDLHLTRHFSHQASLTAFAKATKAHSDYDLSTGDSTTNTERFSQSSLGVKGDVFALGGKFTGLASEVTSDRLTNGGFVYEGKGNLASLQWERVVSESNDLVLGIEHAQESATALDSVLLDEVELSRTAGFLAHHFALGAFFSDQSVRFESFSKFGDHSNGKLGVGAYLPWDGWRIKASISNGVRAPSLYQALGPFGNLSLAPEKSKGGELGVAFSRDQTQFEIVGFKTNYENFISFGSSRYENIERVEIEGIEAQVARQGRLGGWSLEGTYLSAYDQTNRKELAKRPHFKGSSEVYWSDEESRAALVIAYTGEREDVGRVQMPSYTLVHLRIKSDLSKEMSLRGSVDNLLDKEYEELLNYGTTGRTFTAFLDIKF